MKYSAISKGNHQIFLPFVVIMRSLILLKTMKRCHQTSMKSISTRTANPTGATDLHALLPKQATFLGFPKTDQFTDGYDQKIEYWMKSPNFPTI